MNNIFKLSQNQVHFDLFPLFVHTFVTKMSEVFTSISHCRLCCGSELSAYFDPWCALSLDLHILPEIFS